MGASQSSTADRSPTTATLSEKQRAGLDVSATTTRMAALTLNSGDKGDASASLTADNIAAWSKAYDEDKTGKKVIGTLLQKQDLLANLTLSKAAIADTQIFNLKLSNEITPVTNQKSSGRCWLFAITNCARLAFAKKYNVDDFQFSQSYLFFWDHLEKASFYLENQIELADKPLDDRIVQFLNQDLFNDGGQIRMAENLIQKYGLVPQALYPESWHSSNSGKLNNLLSAKLREHALELRALHDRTMAVLSEQPTRSASEMKKIAVSACRSRKNEQLSEIYTILAMTVGVPPARDGKLTYEYYDKEKKFRSFNLSPIEIYESLAPTFTVGDSISLINDPRNAMNKAYTVARLGNVWEGKPVLYVNTEVDVLEQAIVKMLKANQPVWFGCDVGKASNTALGIMDADLFDYEGTFGIKLGMTKAERLQTFTSVSTHAMVIVGAHVDEKTGKPVRYRVENSWSADAGTKGYFVMTSDWFREYAYQIVCAKKLAPPELVKILESTEPVILPPYDPMGALACI